MSRLGKKGITLPANTELTVSGNTVTVKGPKGTLSMEAHPKIKIAVEGQEVTFTPVEETLETKALWGTMASRVNGMVKGVNEPFKKVLLLEGVGYRGEVQGKQLKMALGFSHPVLMDIPEGVTVTVEKGTFTFTGIDKVVVGQFAANVRAKKKPEPYKGKGFRYDDEVIRRKQGKKSV